MAELIHAGWFDKVIVEYVLLTRQIFKVSLPMNTIISHANAVTQGSSEHAMFKNGLDINWCVRFLALRMCASESA